MTDQWGRGFNRVAHKPASPDTSARQTILGSVTRVVAIVTVAFFALAIVAVLVWSGISQQKRQAERLDQISQLIAPDLAWREIDRLQHSLDVQLEGDGLFLDAAGNAVAGDVALLDQPRREVQHEGELVGYVIAPNAAEFRIVLPVWMISLIVLMGVFASFISARLSSARIASSVEQLTDYANSIATSEHKISAPEGEYAELSTLREAMEQAAVRTKREARRLRGAAFADPITGLPNLTYLREAIASRVNAMSIEAPGAFVLLDLDGFIRASESCGPNGDQNILSAAVARIKTIISDFEEDGVRMLFASLQADNFALFLPKCPNGRDGVAAIVRRLNSAFEAPLAIGDRLISIGISAGITMLPEDGSTLKDLKRRANMALQEARKTSGNSFAFYAPRFDRIAKGRFQLEAELRTATRNSEFIPVFQPKVDFATGRIMGAEALARWHRDGGKIVMPGTFIGVAEEIGLIEEIGHQILKASCEAAADWYQRGYNIPVAVNVSPLQFEQPDFADTVIEALESSGLPPHLLELEITESMAIEDPQKVGEVMEPLRTMGVRLAIDDFGTGHSNLAVLTQLPFDVFKIDRQFVSALKDDHQAPAIIEMILAMSETLGLKTVAEGVETERQAAFLRKRGCALGQGFLYSPGVTLDNFLNLLEESGYRGKDFLQQSVG